MRRLYSRSRTQKKSEAKDSPSKDRPSRGQEPRTQTQVFFKKKKVPQKDFPSNLPKKDLQKFFQVISKKKNGLEKNFSADLQNFNHLKNSAVLGPRKGNFRGLEASRSRPRTLPSRPKPRTSKCVLEAKDVLEDSTSV